jgi:hypothetical protein
VDALENVFPDLWRDHGVSARRHRDNEQRADGRADYDEHAGDRVKPAGFRFESLDICEHDGCGLAMFLLQNNRVSADFAENTFDFGSIEEMNREFCPGLQAPQLLGFC